MVTLWVENLFFLRNRRYNESPMRLTVPGKYVIIGSDRSLFHVHVMPSSTRTAKQW